jgi:outer membrane protein
MKEEGIMRVMVKAVLPVVMLAAVWVVGAWWTPPPAGAQAAAPAATNSRVGFIDTQRVMTRSAAGVTAREALERDKAAMQKQVDTLQSELAKLKDDLEKKGQLLSAEVRKEKQDTMERKVRDLRRLADDFEKDLAKKDRELMVKFARELQGVVQKVGKERGYTLIVDARAGVIYGAPEADLTEEIIKEFDAAAKKGAKP